MIKKILCLTLIATSGQAFAETWVGGTAELTVAANWSPASVPVAGGIGIFDSSGNPAPVLNGAVNFQTGTLSFPDSTAYTFTIGAALRQFVLDTNGIVSAGGTKTFNVAGSNALLAFVNAASADSANVNITGSTARLEFYDAASADSANINITGPSTAGVRFFQTATAGSSIITATGTDRIAHFFNTSTASNSQINLVNGGTASFFQSSSAGFANITASGFGSQVIVTNTATAGNAQINLSNSAQNLYQSTGSAGSATINATTSALISFSATSTAANAQINLTGPSNLNFVNNSTAGSSLITATGAGAFVQFSNSATGGNAQINLSNGADISISLTSSAGSSIINSTGSGSNVTFGNSATASNAQINLSNSAALTFNAASTGASAAVSLATGALMTINQNNTLGSLNSDATGLVNLNTFNLQIGSNNTSQTFAGVASGLGGRITKVGTGTQILSGINLYTGPTTVNAGQLTLTGSVAGNFVVNAGGTSNGNGTVGGTYTQNAGSFFLVNQPDFLNVVGPVVINGGEVAVADAVYPSNTPFIILHSDVSRTGVYDGAFALNPNPYFVPVLIYDAQNVYLTIATQFLAFGLTPNEIAVAGALDFATDPALIAALTSLGITDFLAALNQLSGVQFANLIQLSELANQRFVKQIFDPMRDAIINPCKQHCGELITWASVEGGQSFLKSDYNARGLKVAEGNVSVGAYRFFNPNLSFGIAGNYEYDHVEFYQGGTGRASTGQGALYGLAFNPLGYLFAEVAGGYSAWDIKRPLDFGGFVATATSKPNIRHVAAYGELGCNTWVNQFLLQPFFALEYGRYWRARATETGADIANLTVAAQNFDDLESRLGAHLSTDFGPILLSADASWRYRYSQLGDRLNVNFSSFGPAFTILGPYQNRSFFEGALYAQTALSPTLLLYVQADGLVNNRFATYSASVGIQKVW